MKAIAVCLATSIFLQRCASREPYGYDDPSLIRIAELQDHRQVDSLISVLRSPNAAYRAAAALAFASIKDTVACPALGSVLLEDPDSTARINASFALGQTGGIAAVNALISALQDKNHAVVRESLESLGKTIGKNDIEVLQGFEPTDRMTREGYAWGLYRLGARGLADSLLVGKAIALLSLNNSVVTRTGAANFFGRSPLKGSVFERALIASVMSDPSPDVRLAAAVGLRKLQDEEVIDVIEKVLKSEKDYRIRINAVRSLSAFEPERAKTLYLLALKDPQINVGIAASEGIAGVTKPAWPELIEIARNEHRWRIQANLYKAIVKANPSSGLVEEIKKQFNASSNPYQKAWLLGAIAPAVTEYRFINQALIASKTPVVKSSAAEALVSINYDKKFPASLKNVFGDIYKAAVLDGDPAVVGIVSAALADSVLGYRGQFTDISFLRNARAKMTLPKDLESLQPLEDAIAFLEERHRPPALRNKWNHPIAWEIIRSIGKNERVHVETSRGEIIMRLLPDEAPGSVANFVDLLKKGYFDGKFFHRTVPNFVIQTGCNRGDGFGSEDYSIRSEFSRRRYAAGSVGMASAGKDTEGTQWFITHSSTSNLDGRYTIFATIEKGMDVVDRIEVGDRIISMRME